MITKNPSALILGASAGLGRALAETLAAQKNNLILVARDGEDLQAISADLSIRFSVVVKWECIDLATDNIPFRDLFSRWSREMDGLERVYLVAGGSFDGDEGISSYEALEKSTRLNFLSIAHALNGALSSVVEFKCQYICVVSSIAAPVPRWRNAAYAASKRALENYVLSMRHFCFKKGWSVKIQILRLGYMDSNFTFGQSLLFPIVAPGEVAEFLVNTKKDGFLYFPRYWQGIVFLLICLPWRIFRRLNF